MKNYTTVLFDLDHTLWDYEKNSYEALKHLHQYYELYEYGGITLDKFLNTFQKVNYNLWDRYNKKEIDRAYIRNNRFHTILKYFHIEDDHLAMQLSIQYIDQCPQKTHLMPYAKEILGYLSKKYKLILLTNGFDDVQTTKITQSKISDFFQGMITSETCGHRKPAKEIFDYTLATANSEASETLMVGDNLMADIRGARNANLDTVFYNPSSIMHKEPTTYEISCLSEMTSIL